MSKLEYDFLIVGQGLAGTILAHMLITQGMRVMVLDNTYYGSSSHVAAGIINPITGPRLKNNDEFNSYFSIAAPYYAKLEYHIKETVFKPIKQDRQIFSDEQYDFLKKRLHDPNYHKLIELNTQPNDHFNSSKYPQLTISNTAVVDTKTLLLAGQKWLTSIDSYCEHKFDYDQLNIQDQKVEYQHYSADKVIFCEGFQATKNPWLKHLPFKLAKGEILTLDLNGNDLKETMLSWSKWLVPVNNSSKLGSNFEWHDLTLRPNDNVKNELLESLRQHTKLEVNILAHETGIRPSTKQRMPFVGAISNNPRLYCFNGFGSKGCLLIPHYAQLLCKHLSTQSPLPKKITQWL